MAKQNVKTESWVENYFQLQQHGTTVKTEVIAGLTTFFTMAYIIVVNPGIISMGDGQIYNGVFFATCISAFIGTALMAFLAKIPFAQAPGMGLNAFFAFTVMPAMIKITGKDLTIIEQYQCALALVFMSGLLFILITVIGAREAIVKAIPQNVKLAISGGIGLFLAYLGLQNAGIVVPDPAVQVGLINFAGIVDPEQRMKVMGAILAILGLFIITALYKLKVKGSILIGILVTGVLAYFPFGIAKLPDSFAINFGAQAKDFMDVSFFRLDFGTLFAGKNLMEAIATVLVLILTFSMVDMFDTIGTLLGTASAAGLMDEDGNMERMKPALLSDAIATA
ncbi:MAG: NCS2 family permease, partial [Hydrogenoanaerobacterium sp.]